MSASQFPEQGILWRGWSEETLRAIEDKKWPVLLFVADPDPMVWPFLRGIFNEMPANAKLRALLHEFFLALFIKADALPEHLEVLGGGGPPPNSPLFFPGPPPPDPHPSLVG